MVNVGSYAKAGRPIDEKTIAVLAKHKVPFVYTVSPTYEEKQSFSDETEEKKFFENWAEKSFDDLTSFREELVELLSAAFVPFNEEDQRFVVKGKKKILTYGGLFSPKYDPILQPDIDAGSLALLPPTQVARLNKLLGEIFDHLNHFTYRGTDTVGKKNALPRLNLASVRLQPLLEAGRISKPGTALAWHAVDTAVYFLAAMLNINKKRQVMGFPVSTQRFDVDSSFNAQTVFRYKDEYLVEAALGILLHPWGFCYDKIMSLQAGRPLLDPSSAKDRDKIELLRKNILVMKSLLRNRNDISAVARMVAFGQHDHPDGTGYPPSAEKRVVHEFVRLFHIADFYDSLTNPYFHRTAYDRSDVIQYMQRNSGAFPPGALDYPMAYRFDFQLLDEFLWILSPYDSGEKVYLFPQGSLSTPHFVGRIYNYYHSSVPLVSILRDERQDQNYPFGKLVFDLENGAAFLMEEGKIVKKTLVPWIGKLKIHDVSVNPGDLEDYQDLLYGQPR